MRRWQAVLVGLLFLGLFASPAVGQEIKNPDTFVKVTYNSIETLDPQFMISSATCELSDNVYNSLLDHPQGQMDAFIPSLAGIVPSLDNGMLVIADDGTTFITFTIRSGVMFHEGGTLTAEDVEYTFERAILVGAIYENWPALALSLLGKDFAALVDEIGYDAAFDQLDAAIEQDGLNVTFELPKPFVPFLGIIADSGQGTGILDKEWCIEQGCWDGTKETGQAHMGLTLEEDPLFDKMNGTGPFKLVTWEPGQRVVLERFEDYWEGPARLKRVVRQIVTDNQAAILMFNNGDADFYDIVDPAAVPQIKGTPGVVVHEGLPVTMLRKINFNMNIAENSPYMGSGQLDGEGIPADLFSDKDVRLGFLYAFDYDAFINEVMLGASLKPYGPVLIGFPTANPDNPTYSLDLARAEEHLRLAWGGEVWEKGFTFTATFSAGSTHRQRCMEILQANLAAINPKFVIEIASVPWATYSAEFGNSTAILPVFGFIPTFFDPYPTLFDHMHASGGYPTRMGYTELAAEKYTDLVDELGSTFDMDRRTEISYQLQLWSYEDALAIMHQQGVQNIALRDWVQGWYAGPAPFNLDFYPIYKAYE